MLYVNQLPGTCPYKGLSQPPEKRLRVLMRNKCEK
jgi:hypothetical protein